jgi:hypothetical protein
MRHTTAIALGLAALAAVPGARAGSPPGVEDDLAVVKKAVASPAPRRRASTAVPAVVAPPTAPPVVEAPSSARAGGEPRWFKVRVVDRATGNRKVTINLPLTVVRALGDHSIDVACHPAGEHERCHDLRLSDILRSLDRGQELVDIEDEEASVRVWVE